MSLTKRWFEQQQQRESEAARRAADLQAEIMSDLDRIAASGKADRADIERMRVKQGELAGEIEILRRLEEQGDQQQ